MQSRRALRALKGLVRLQALIRGQAVRRQTADTLRGLESLMRIQARHRSSAGADDDDDALLLRRGRELYAAAVHVSSHIHTPPQQHGTSAEIPYSRDGSRRSRWPPEPRCRG